MINANTAGSIPPVFLTAEWRKLLMVNYEADVNILKPYLPEGTEPDLFEGRCLVSMVGFLFLHTRLKGWVVPFHQRFEEVNLPFYVRRKVNGKWRRGTVFIAEFVPKPMIALVARKIYGEQYFTRKMSHSLEIGKEELEATYRWKMKNWYSISIRSENRLCEVEAGSETEFIMEHYWGYTLKGKEFTAEYGVEHPRWQVYPTLHFSANIDFEDCYGSDFSTLNAIKPSSAFLLEGSEILVREGRIIKV
jgi:uncharacterized protein YqjF (DUF2071 family)